MPINLQNENAEYMKIPQECERMSLVAVYGFICAVHVAVLLSAGPGA